LGDHDTYAIKGDKIAAKRLQIKSKAKEARRSVRYRKFEQREVLMEKAAKAAHLTTIQIDGKARAMAAEPDFVSISDKATNGTEHKAATKEKKTRKSPGSATR
jgi:hypothetical protein